MLAVNPVKRVFLLTIILMLILAACTTPSAQPASPDTSMTEPGTGQTAGNDTTPAATEPPALPTPTTALPDPVSLELVDQGFTMATNDTVHYGFLVRNPNPYHAVQNSTFTATFFDAAGAVLGTDDLGAIELVLPGQTLGVGDGLWLDDPAVASMSVALTSGEPVVLTEALPSYQVSTGSICSIVHGMGMRAEIFNPYASNILLPRISVIYYDAAGKIIGAGTGYRSGLAANAKTGVLIWGYYGEGMDHYEVYPGYRGIPSLVSNLPSDAQPVKVTASGYTVNGTTLTYSVIIENPNSAYMVDLSVLSVNAYAADGKLVAGEPLRLIHLLPGQKLGISQDLDLCDGDVVDHIEVAIGSGEYTTSQESTYLVSENVTLQEGTVSGDLVNQSGMEIKVFYATAIVFDANDQIIGGGSQTVELIAAGGRVSVQIPVAVNGTPVRAELYAVLTPKSLPK